MYISLCLALNNVLILFLYVTAKKQHIVPITTQDSIIITSDKDANGEDDVDVEQTSATCAYVLRKHGSTLNIIAKQMQASLGNLKEVDDEGLLMDIDVQPIDEDVSLASCEDKRRDVDHFFQSRVEKTVNGKIKKYCNCKLCLYVSHTSICLATNEIYNLFSRRQKEHCERSHNFMPSLGGTSLSESVTTSTIPLSQNLISAMENTVNGLKMPTMSQDYQAISRSVRQQLNMQLTPLIMISRRRK